MRMAVIVMVVAMRLICHMRTTDAAAGLTGGGHSFRHDLANSAGTASALGTTAEASINLSCRARTGLVGRLARAPDVMVRQNITGTNDHEGGRNPA